MASVRISGHAGVELAADRSEQRRGVEPRVGVELREGRPVGRQEMGLGLGAQDRLAEIPGELLVGRDRVRLLAEDADLLGPEAEVDGRRVDEQRAEPVADDRQRDVAAWGDSPFAGVRRLMPPRTRARSSRSEGLLNLSLQPGATASLRPLVCPLVPGDRSAAAISP